MLPRMTADHLTKDLRARSLVAGNAHASLRLTRRRRHPRRQGLPRVKERLRQKKGRLAQEKRVRRRNRIFRRLPRSLKRLRTANRRKHQLQRIPNEAGSRGSARDLL